MQIAFHKGQRPSPNLIRCPLIVLLLCSKGALREPLLYPSLYFKTYRQRYYDLLQRIRTHGEWELWLSFFLEAIDATARKASEAVVQSLRLFESDRKRIYDIGRSAHSALALQEYMQKKPVMTIAAAAKALQLTVPTITNALKH
jgi:Fic family protein